MTTLPFPFPLAQAEVLRRRATILAKLCAQDKDFSTVPVHSIRLETLNAMLDLYDGLFLSGMLRRTYGRIDVTLSSRMTSSAGKFICLRGAGKRIQHVEICMSSDFLFRLNEGPFHLNGLDVSTPQEAFLVVFEHEICHALETALYGGTGHSSRFLQLANGLFGHTDTRHSLPTRREEAAQSGLVVGARVSFPFESETLHGVIRYVGKMATVLVPDARGMYQDRRGQRYAKYRVPLSLLKKE